MASSEQVCCHSDAGAALSLCPSSLCLPCVVLNWHLALCGGPGGTRHLEGLSCLLVCFMLGACVSH